MIIFYNKKTGEILGSLEGRVHFREHMKVSVSRSDTNNKDILKVVIGYEDTGKTEKFINDNGEEQERTIYKEHNLHLWKHQLDFEDPKNPKFPHNHKVKLDKKGNPIDFVPKKD